MQNHTQMVYFSHSSLFWAPNYFQGGCLIGFPKLRSGHLDMFTVTDWCVLLLIVSSRSVYWGNGSATLCLRSTGTTLVTIGMALLHNAYDPQAQQWWLLEWLCYTMLTIHRHSTWWLLWRRTANNLSYNLRIQKGLFLDIRLICSNCMHAWSIYTCMHIHLYIYAFRLHTLSRTIGLMLIETRIVARNSKII